MNLINTTVISQNISLFSNWVDSTSVPKMVDTVTYDLYESDNPFRHRFNDKQIKNDALRHSVNATAAVGAEAYSMFANPYYLTHKIINLPMYIPASYKKVAEMYSKYSINKAD